MVSQEGGEKGAWAPVKRLLHKFNSELIAAKTMTVGSMVGRIMVSPKMSKGFPGAPVVESPPVNAGDADSIPASGRCLEKEMATLHILALGSLMDREAWWATAHGVTKESDRTQ